MPRQIKDKNKSTRMRYALDAIEHHGRCSHKEITEFVANKIDADPDLSSFKKAIHNDIKDLIKDHQIGIEYFTPAGDTIPLGEEDNHKNKRTQYFIIGGESQIKGNNLLSKFGAIFIPQRLSSPDWSIKQLKFESDFQTSKIGIILNFHGYKFIIETNEDEIPLRIAVGRKDKFTPSLELLENTLGKRTSLLFLPWMLLSSSKPEQLCHFVINFHHKKDIGLEVNLDFIQGQSQTDDDFLAKINNVIINKSDDESILRRLEYELGVPGTYTLSEMSSESPEINPTKIQKIPSNSSIDGGTLPLSIKLGPKQEIIIANFGTLKKLRVPKSA